jgi:general secretion pathway protein A
VDENKTIVLIIDEGQKLTPSFLEILRTLLNYETNEYKLLQLVILAQMELLPKIRKIRNFTDRIATKYIINPLDERETGQMIKFRLEKAGYDDSRQDLFTAGAVNLIFSHTQGYPRKISLLCHNALEHIVMNQQEFVDEKVISDLIMEELKQGWDEEQAEGLIQIKKD